jgi:hypothetical protein
LLKILLFTKSIFTQNQYQSFMKKLLLLLGAFLTISAAQAQYYYLQGNGSNPGNLNTDDEYPPGGGLTTGWTTLFTGSAASFTAPVWTSDVTLPFAFNFNGSPVTSYKVATSGVVTFTTTATAVPSDVNTALPSVNIPDKSIVAWGLAANAGDFVITKTFGTAPNRQHWISFNSYSSPGSTTIFTYWSIVLEETSNKIYIVDQRSNAALTLTAGIQVNSTTAFQVTGSPNLSSLTTTTADPTPADNNYYAFAPGVQPTYDMSVTSITNANYLVLANAPFNITGSIKNLGTAPVTSFTLNYKINNGATVYAPITPNISSAGSYPFSHTTTWTPAASGIYTITAWATNINGNADQNTANDNGSKQVYVAANTATRTVLHEVFTSSTCPPCLPGNQNLRTITQANPGKSIDIKYQQNFPAPGNDQYQSAESINRRGYYAVNSIPRMEVDGGWDGNANSYTTPLLNNFRSKPAIIGVSGTHTIVGHTVTAQAVIDPIGNNIANNNLVVHMVITEKRSVNNHRTNGETEFFDVMKKMMPSELGNNIPALVAGTPQTINQTYTFPTMAPGAAVNKDSVENFNNLEVTIFVQDKVTREVFQAAKSVRTNSPTGIAEDKAAMAVSVFPNPSNGLVTVIVPQEKSEMVKMTVFNTLGQQVWSNEAKLMNANDKVEIDLSAQARGIYFVNVQIGDKTSIKKVSLVK